MRDHLHYVQAVSVAFVVVIAVRSSVYGSMAVAASAASGSGGLPQLVGGADDAGSLCGV